MACLINEGVIVINQRKDNSRDKPEAELNLFCSTVSPLFCCFSFSLVMSMVRLFVDKSEDFRRRLSQADGSKWID